MGDLQYFEWNDRIDKAKKGDQHATQPVAVKHGK